MSRHYSLDSIVIRGRRIFGWGFHLDTERPVLATALRVPLAAGGMHEIGLMPSGFRADLAEAFPGVAHAGFAGFMVSGLLPSPPANGKAFLLLDVEQGESGLPGFPDAYMPAVKIPIRGAHARFLGIARQRGWREAFRASLAGAYRRLLQSLPEMSLVQRARHAAVIFDHAMGGGANRYRQNRVKALLGEGLPVLVVAGELASLSYSITLHALDGSTTTQRVDTQDEVIALVVKLRPAVLEINSLIGFEEVSTILGSLTALKLSHPVMRLRFHLHDFHAVCPSFTLIDADGRHCGVPGLPDCRTCLPRNSRFTLGLNADIDPGAWRMAWSKFLSIVDERIAFSTSSLRLLQRGFDADMATAWRIEPHAIDNRDLRVVPPCLDETMNIVAVGHLNHAKGAGLVVALAERAKERGLPMRFTVIGTLEGGQHNPDVRITGAFNPSKLCDLLETERAGITFLPSICPETYSYVTDELMATGLPLAVLDLGAPAERVARYASGLLLPIDGIDAQLDALMGFAQYLRSTR